MLRDRAFRTLWLAQFVSIFGDFLALFGVISLITFRMHGTAVQVTAVSIAYIVPLALISPVAGVFVDHWNVKRLMIASDLIRAVLIMLLLFARDVAQICVIFAALSTVSSFFAPAVGHGPDHRASGPPARRERDAHAGVLRGAAVFPLCRGRAHRLAR